MKTSRFTNSVFAAFSALALLFTVALTGCDASDMTGPDTAPAQAETVQDGSVTANSEGGDGTGTGTTGSRNTLPSED